MSHTLELEGAALLAWRRTQLAKGGEAANLDWLIDLAGGVSWTVLQRLLLDASDARVSLHLSLDELAQLWERHLAFDEPLQHLVGQCCLGEVMSTIVRPVAASGERLREFPQVCLCILCCGILCMTLLIMKLSVALTRLLTSYFSMHLL